MHSAGLTISETAARTALSAYTLRYYEDEGLLLSIARDEAGHRRYSERDIEWIGMVMRLKSTGMPIEDIRRYAHLCRVGEQPDERLALLQRHRDRIDAVVQQSLTHLAAIDAKIDGYLSEEGEQRPVA
ncbi:MerR family transcriptional regulator [Luteipulveratus sp. YIM 133132]|uniref:MerR family transcriptional regulator n=1 Tax=Luteipulveratus flavus TaxID=3031728 RepID=A0ABT6C4F4_9MICO|nr:MULTISPECIES: MerR family transcriptional regulator [unclassified Luteipulveratus]MDE9364067.1 MerR family transcriptional regulator [Luteipulveratus sp. YIM 133132]MDF8263571.1 MerR family transcriptional regulator [Luteipulveratus sp. YIM 133296]